MQRLRSSIPDMQKTLDTVKFLDEKKVVCVGVINHRNRKMKLRLDLSLMIRYMRLRPFRLLIRCIYGLGYWFCDGGWCRRTLWLHIPSTRPKHCWLRNSARRRQVWKHVKKISNSFANKLPQWKSISVNLQLFLSDNSTDVQLGRQTKTGNTNYNRARRIRWRRYIAAMQRRTPNKITLQSFEQLNPPVPHLHNISTSLVLLIPLCAVLSVIVL